MAVSRDHEARVRAFYRGVRACIEWLHQEAREMNDPHARSVLNSAAFHLGIDKPDPNAAAADTSEPQDSPGIDQ